MLMIMMHDLDTALWLKKIVSYTSELIAVDFEFQ